MKHIFSKKRHKKHCRSYSLQLKTLQVQNWTRSISGCITIFINSFSIIRESIIMANVFITRRLMRLICQLEFDVWHLLLIDSTGKQNPFTFAIIDWFSLSINSVLHFIQYFKTEKKYEYYCVLTLFWSFTRIEMLKMVEEMKLDDRYRRKKLLKINKVCLVNLKWSLLYYETIIILIVNIFLI